jgi:hypothetical protein
MRKVWMILILRRGSGYELMMICLTLLSLLFSGILLCIVIYLDIPNHLLWKRVKHSCKQFLPIQCLINPTRTTTHSRTIAPR